MNPRFGIFFGFVAVLSIGAVAIATCYECPDWPECSDTHGCGCKDGICMPIQERASYGPLQSLDTGDEFNDFTNNGSQLCYKWRTCNEGGLWTGYYCNAGTSSGACVEGAPAAMCIGCYSSGEWHTVNRTDYDCFDS